MLSGPRQRIRAAVGSASPAPPPAPSHFLTEGLGSVRRESPELPLGREKLQQETSCAGAVRALPPLPSCLLFFFGEGVSLKDESSGTLTSPLH